jgi:hypothetical protein
VAKGVRVAEEVYWAKVVEEAVAELGPSVHQVQTTLGETGVQVLTTPLSLELMWVGITEGLLVVVRAHLTAVVV